MIIPSPYNKILPSLKTVTPVKMYLDQVNNIMDGIRAQANGQAFIPNQYGGLFGQTAVFREKVVLQSIDFDLG